MESKAMERKGENKPFFPSNYVTLKMLKERWEENQRRLAQQEEEEEEEEEEEKAAAEAPVSRCIPKEDPENPLQPTRADHLVHAAADSPPLSHCNENHAIVTATGPAADGAYRRPGPASGVAARNTGAARGLNGSDERSKKKYSRIEKDNRAVAGGASAPGKATKVEAVVEAPVVVQEIVRAMGSGGAETNQRGIVNRYWKMTKDKRPVAGGTSAPGKATKVKAVVKAPVVVRETRATGSGGAATNQEGNANNINRKIKKNNKPAAAGDSTSGKATKVEAVVKAPVVVRETRATGSGGAATNQEGNANNINWKIKKNNKPAAAGDSASGKATEMEAAVKAPVVDREIRITGSGGAATNQKLILAKFWKITKDNKPVAGGGPSLRKANKEEAAVKTRVDQEAIIATGGGAAATNERDSEMGSDGTGNALPAGAAYGSSRGSGGVKSPAAAKGARLVWARKNPIA